MSTAKRIIAFALALCFTFVIASCTNDTKTNESMATTTAATTTAPTTTNQTTAVTSKETTASTTTVATTTAFDDSRFTPVCGHPPYQTIPTAPKLTTDKNGNPSQAFIKGLKGYTLKIHNPWENYAPGTELYESDHFVETEIEKEFGVNIVVSGMHEGYTETVAAGIVSGRPDADIYRVEDVNYYGFLRQNYMTNLNKAMSTSGVDMRLTWFNQEARVFFNVNGGQYAWAENDLEPYVILYNKDMIKKAGLADPAALAEKRQWTWDVMESYAKKLSSDKVIGLSCHTDYNDFYASMVISGGGALVPAISGAVKTNIDSTAARNALNTLSDWTKNSVLSILDENTPRDTLLKKFANGELAMFLASGITQIDSPKDTNEFTVGVAPFPTPKAGQIYVTQKQIKYAEFIPAPKAADAAKILFIRNEIYRLASRFKDRDIQVKYMNLIRLNSSEMKCLANLKFNYNEYKSYVNLVPYAERQNADIKTEDIVNKVIKESKDAQWAIDTYGLQLEQEYLSAWKGYIITAK